MDVVDVRAGDFKLSPPISNTIRVKLEAASFRLGLEIFMKMGSIIHFRFRPDGFVMMVMPSTIIRKGVKEVEGTPRQQSVGEYVFKKGNLLRYKYRVNSLNGQEYPHHDTSLYLKDMVSRVGDVKKDYISFRVRVGDFATDDAGIEINTQGSGGVKNVPTIKPPSVYPGLLQYSRFYDGVDPHGKIAPNIFLGAATITKKSQVPVLEFRRYRKTGNIHLCAWPLSGDPDPVCSEPLDGDLSNSEYEIDENIGQGFGIRKIILKQNEWIHKMPKLSKSVIQIYIDSENPLAPLCLCTFLGTQATAAFYISNINVS